MSRLPTTLALDKQGRDKLKEKPLRDLLKRLFERLEFVYRIFRQDFEVMEKKVDAGVATGWFDDGTNFRITVTNGIITAISDSSGAGHS